MLASATLANNPPPASSGDNLVHRQPRACASCASAKAKCVPQRKQSSTTGCERCSRIEIQCVSQPPMLRKRREVKAVRVGQLEQKVDSIVSFLSQSQPSLPPLTQQLPLLPLTQPFRSVSIPKFPPDHSLSVPNAPPLFPSPPKSYGGSPSSTPSGFSGSNTLLDLNLSPVEEQSRLNLFRQITQYFPFVVIPPSTSAPVLRREKPFLFAAIMLAASNGSSSYNKCIGRKLMEYLSVRLILNGERSFDLLLGTLVFTAWCNQRHQHNPQISNLIQLAVSMVVELGINRPPAANSKQYYLLEATDVEICERPVIPKTHPSDAMRAFLGCYYLSSVISSSFKKVEAMPSTPYVDKCSRSLEEADEFPTDRILSYLVRLQYSVQNIAQNLPAESLEARWELNTPVLMFIEALAAQLRATQLSLPLELQQDAVLLAHYHETEVFLHETGFCEPPQGTTMGSKDDLFPRLKLLQSCLASTKTFLDTFFLIPPEQYPHLPFITWTQLSYTLKITGRLHLIKLEGWDHAYVRSTIKFASVLEQLVFRFTAAGKYGDPQEEENIFLQFARMMRWSLSNYHHRSQANSLAAATVPIEAAHNTYRTEEQGHAGNDRAMGNLDDLFWQEFMVEWGSTI